MQLKKLFLLGDIGYFTPSLHLMVNHINQISKPNEPLVILGDNFYPSGINSPNDNQLGMFHDTFKDTKNPIFSILGNHDYVQNPEAQINHDNWIMSNWYYKKEYDNVDLYFMDTTQFGIHDWVPLEKIEKVHNLDYQTLIGDQLEWLNSEIGKNKNKKKIVFGHYPIITNGRYIQKMKPLYDYLIYTFKRNNVSLFISGHEHNIQYIKRDYENDYTFNQIVVGSSSDVRFWEENYLLTDGKPNDMFDNQDNYFAELIVHDHFVVLKFYNAYRQLKYQYKIKY